MNVILAIYAAVLVALFATVAFASITYAVPALLFLIIGMPTALGGLMIWHEGR